MAHASEGRGRGCSLLPTALHLAARPTPAAAADNRMYVCLPFPASCVSPDRVELRRRRKHNSQSSWTPPPHLLLQTSSRIGHSNHVQAAFLSTKPKLQGESAST